MNWKEFKAAMKGHECAEKELKFYQSIGYIGYEDERLWDESWLFIGSIVFCICVGIATLLSDSYLLSFAIFILYCFTLFELGPLYDLEAKRIKHNTKCLERQQEKIKQQLKEWSND